VSYLLSVGVRGVGVVENRRETGDGRRMLRWVFRRFRWDGGLGVWKAMTAEDERRMDGVKAPMRMGEDRRAMVATILDFRRRIFGSNWIHGI